MFENLIFHISNIMKLIIISCGKAFFLLIFIWCKIIRIGKIIITELIMSNSSFIARIIGEKNHYF